MINFYELCNKELNMSYMQEDIEILAESKRQYDIIKYQTCKDYSSVLHIIKKDIRLAYWYAYQVIKGRWPEAEPYIMKKSGYAYQYARYIIGGRWPEAEPIIRDNEYYSFLYDKNVIK